MKINLRSILLGSGAIIAFAYGTYKTYSYFNPIQDKSDISYASQKLEYLPVIVFSKPLLAPETIIDIEIPSTAGTIRWYLAQAIAQQKDSTGNDAPYALRFCVPDAPSGQSPNKISENWVGGLKTAKAKLSEDPDFCNGVKFIAGHYPFGLHKNLKTGDVKYTVLLRDPIEQAVSDTNLAYQRGYISKSEAKHYLLHGRIDNVQTRIIAGEKYMSGECNAEVLHVAKQNIENHFLLAGVTEDTNKFLQVLASIMQAGPIAVTKAQASGDKAIVDVDQAIRDSLITRNQFDAELYEWIKIRWSLWKQQHTVGELRQDDRTQKILCITPEFARTRAPVFMTQEEIASYNAARTDKLIREDQDYPSNLKFRSV